MNQFKIINSLIDVAGFYGGNWALHGAVHIPKPHMRHVIIFGLADGLIRNGFLKTSYVEGLLPSATSVNLKADAYISLMYALIAGAYDSLIDSETAKTAIVDNLIRGAVGLGTNILIDYALPVEYK